MNNTILKKIIKECIINNNSLNNNIYDLYGHYFELKQNIIGITIILSCSLLFTLIRLIKN